MKIGIIIARFQTSYLHEGHISLIRYVKKRNDAVVIFLGSCETKLTINNPLDYESRQAMIHGLFPEVTVCKLSDTKYDSVWNNNLDLLLKKLYPDDDIVLYGSRDSFIQYYKGEYRSEVFQELPSISATRIRSGLHEYIKDDISWREGIIYASANKYPVSYQAVDVAIINFDKNEILLGRKLGESKFRLIGGFVDVNDDSLEAAAKREAKEECGDIETDAYKYLGSFRVDDWRYKKSHDKIMTALFYCSYIYGRVNAQDDINELKWFNISSLLSNDIEPEHHILIQRIRKELYDTL